MHDRIKQSVFRIINVTFGPLLVKLIYIKSQGFGRIIYKIKGV